MANASSTAWFQSLPSTSRSAIVAAEALVWSLTCSDPPDSVHATQLSTVPKQRSRPARSPLLARIQASFVTDWFGASAQPCSARAIRHSPIVRRSCQPRPGPIGSPGRAIPDDRAGPLVGDADGDAPARPTVASTACAASSTLVAMSAASNSTRPGAGLVGGHGRYSSARRRSVVVDDGGPQAGRADVDHQERSHRSLQVERRSCIGARHDARPRCGHGHGTGPNAEVNPSLPGLRIPCGSSAVLIDCSTAWEAPNASGMKRARFRPTP